MTKNSDYSLFILLWDLVKVWNVHFIDRISVGLSKNFFRKDRIDHYQDLYLVRQSEPAFKANVRGLYWLVRSQESGLSCKISKESIIGNLPSLNFYLSNLLFLSWSKILLFSWSNLNMPYFKCIGDKNDILTS